MKAIITFFSTHRRILIIGAVILLIATVLSSQLGNNQEVTEEAPDTLPSVTLATANTLQTTGSFTVIGTVLPADEGIITSRSTGQVVRVTTRVGDRVTAGAVVAELESTQQRSAVRQAEAALAHAQTGLPSAAAGAATRVVSIREAEQAIESAQDQVRNTLTTAFSTTQRIITQDIDPFYANPRQGIPGLRIGNGNVVLSLNAERVAYRDILPDWENRLRNIDNASTDILFLEIEESRSTISRTISWIDTLISTLANERSNRVFTDDRIRELRTQLAQTRDSLVNQRGVIDSTRSNLQRSLEARERAGINDIDTDTTRAEADIAQVQARLDSARTDLNDRLVRSPVSGTVNELDITIGDFISVGTPAGRVANNQSIEIEVFVSPRERVGLTIGDRVTVNQTESGVITDIAPTIDDVSRKQKITIAPVGGADLTVNDTARVTFTLSTPASSDSIFIPITALQFTGTDGAVLRVDDENILYAVPVELGRTRNDTIEIRSGLDADTEFVRDARGKRVGTKVTVVRQ